MKTSTIPVSAPSWFVLDAEGLRIGTVASKVATVLRGKHKPQFSPHQLCGDHVIIMNAAKLSIPPEKDHRKVYYDHTGYPGGLRRTSLGKMMQEKPAYVLERAIKGMLPKNRLRAEILKRLHVFADTDHPYAPQQPSTLDLSKL